MKELTEKLSQMVLTANINEMVLYHGELYPKKEVIQETIDTLEKVEHEREVLINRCKIFTQGSLCLFCPLDCIYRNTDFRGEVATNDSRTDKGDS